MNPVGIQEAHLSGCSCPGRMGWANLQDYLPNYVSDPLKIIRLRTEMQGNHKPNLPCVNSCVLAIIKPNTNLVLKWYLVMESKFLLLCVVIKQTLVLRAVIKQLNQISRAGNGLLAGQLQCPFYRWGQQSGEGLTALPERLQRLPVGPAAKFVLSPVQAILH